MNDNYDFENVVLQSADLVEPILKEQLLKEYILGADENILKLYEKLFDIPDDTQFTIIIIRPEKTADYTELNFLKNMIAEEFSRQICLCSILADSVLAVSYLTPNGVVSAIQKLKRSKKVDINVSVAYSNSHTIKDLPETYLKLSKCMKYSFYGKMGGVFINENIMDAQEKGIIELDCNEVERAVRCGDSDKMNYLIFEIFRDIEKYKPEPMIARTYCLELFVCIIRCCDSEKIGRYMKGLTILQEMATLFEIKEYILNTANEISENNSSNNNKYSALISDTLNIIEKNIGNEHLTLSWIARKVLYTNVDYLGKLFKKETGKNFSAYVMEKRMELAKKLIVADKKDKIYEVAEKVGYGSNSQYFSQVFKKYTGMSPITYKEISRISCSG